MGLSPPSLKFNYITVSLIILVTGLVEPSKCTQVIHNGYKIPGLYTTNPDLMKSVLKQGKPTPYLWIGPRLGRRQRNQQVENEDVLEHILDNDDITNIIIDNPWSMVPLKDNIRTVNTFKPRLGRDSGEEEFFKLFTPRMGRRQELVPRLRREYIMEY